MRLFISAFLFAACATTTVAAQDNTQEKQPDWLIGVGAGALIAPAFEGSDDYNLMAIPDIRVSYKDKFFASVPEGIGYNVINNNGWRAGPIGKVHWGREEDGGSPWRVAGTETTSLRGLGDVDATFEAGGFVEYTWQEHYATKLELRQGMGGHEGLVGEAGISYKDRYGDIGYAIGPRLKWASEDYNQTFFGIDAGQSARSGLATYEADAGLVSYGIGGVASMPLTEQLRLSMIAGYDHMGEEAADSPLIDQRGSEHQFMAGASVVYMFGFH